MRPRRSAETLSPEGILEVFRAGWELGLTDSMLAARYVLDPRDVRRITQGLVCPELFMVTDEGKGWRHVREKRTGAATYAYRLGASRDPKRRVRLPG